jgi:1,4-alpha-glucan branching enzyme
MTGQKYEVFDVGVPQEGTYTEVLNSEKDIYDGCNMCNFEPVVSHKSEGYVTKFENSVTIRIAPFAAIWFTCPKKRTRSRKAVKAD